MANKRKKVSTKGKIRNAKVFNSRAVKRLHTSINFNKTRSQKYYKLNANSDILPKSMYKSNGLSPKEKSFVICSCQEKVKRFLNLKNSVKEALKNNKIFSIYGNCKPVREALLERGWIEKIPSSKMNLSKIHNGHLNTKDEKQVELERLFSSNLIEKHVPDFVWLTKDETRAISIENKTLLNKLTSDAQWTSKQGLCSSMKKNNWFYIEDIAEVNFPRSYTSYDIGEIEEFITDFRITACTSLLKWIVSMVANKRPIFRDDGEVSLNIIVFAINRSKEYLFQKQNKDIDRAVESANLSQWNAFLTKYYKIIAKEIFFQSDNKNNLPLYIEYAKYLLKEIFRYRPQLSCEGCHNIWMIKPAHCSRGRGIRMSSNLAVITNLLTKTNSKYVMQKYIEEPLLIHDTKFDIRQYYLVTSTYPLVIWMYKDCYLKFSSQKYNLRNYHESIHLTNNAIQRKYKNCTIRHPDLPKYNMWDLDKYKVYLNRMGREQAWSDVIYPGMKRSIIGTMLACQDSMPLCKNRFELYGCDFILDKQYRPWLIEINSCPDLSSTTQVTAKICPAVISDIIKVVIDHVANPKAPTGKFECIYKQPISWPKYGGAADLIIQGYSLPIDYFYKGKVERKGSFDEPTIGKEKDINLALNKLKQLYNNDIMIEPDNDSVVNMNHERETCTHISQSEYELNVEATGITEQMNQLNKKISSSSFASPKPANTLDKLYKHEGEGNLVMTPSSDNFLKSIEAATDINALITQTYSRMASKIEGRTKKISFSRLDDEPSKNRSWVLANTVKNSFPAHSEMLSVTEDIVAFFTKKEKELRSKWQTN